MEIKIPKQKKSNPKQSGRSTSSFTFSSLDYFGQNKFKSRFFKELALFSNAGITISDALPLIQEQLQNKNQKSIIASIEQKVYDGLPLSVALEPIQLFNGQDIATVKVGESAGNLKSVFNELNSYYQLKIDQRKTLITTLTYPTVVLFTSIAAVTFMLQFLVPLFKDTFKRSGGSLPRITELIIQLSDNFTFLAAGFLTITLSLIGLHWFLSKNNEAYKLRFSWVIIKTPIIGNFVLQNHLLSVATSFKLLLSSGNTLSEALESISTSCQHPALQELLLKTNRKIKSGSTFYSELKNSSLINPKFLSLINIGEQTNQLSNIFHTISEELQKDQAAKSKQMGSLIEPVLILFLGAIVGLILIGMYLPMVTMNTTMF